MTFVLLHIYFYFYFYFLILYRQGGQFDRLEARFARNKCVAGRRSERGLGTAEVDGSWPSSMVVEKDVVGPSAMAVESDSVGSSPMVTEVGRYVQSSRPDGQLSQHL